jgi:hypothetical protein
MFLLAAGVLVGCGRAPWASPDVAATAAAVRGGAEGRAESVDAPLGPPAAEIAASVGSGCGDAAGRFAAAEASEPAAGAPPSPVALVEPELFAWGTVGPQALGPQPAWVVGFARIEALGPLAGLRIERIRLLDADGGVLAETLSEHELRVASAENLPNDFSAYGTEPIEPDVPAGARLRLRLYGRLDRSFDDLCPRLCSPAAGERYEAVLRTAVGEEIRIGGPLGGAWPTG